MRSPSLTLVDVFSYSCMNCLRSLGYIKRLDFAYRARGLKTIILHAPEWAFEKDKKLVERACKRLGITFPVILDPQRKIIRKMGIDFWPTQVLMHDGKIIYCHVGEGKYRALEGKIRSVLCARGKLVFSSEPTYTRYPAVYAGKRKGGKVVQRNPSGFGKIGVILGTWRQENEALVHSGKEGSLRLISKGTQMSIIAQSFGNAYITIKENERVHDQIKVKEPKLYGVRPFSQNKQRNLTLKVKGRIALYSLGFA